MSVSVIQQPTSGTVYAKNTVPLLILGANEGVHVKIIYKFYDDDSFDPSDIVFEGVYTPDFAGRVTLNFKELYEPYMKTVFPFAGTEKRQDKFLYSFNVIWDGVSSGTGNNVVFNVANAELKSEKKFQAWVRNNFLTNQPMEKNTNYETPEWLTWLDLAGDFFLKVRFYPKRGGNVDLLVTNSSASEPGCYTVDVSYQRLIKLGNFLPDSLLGYYDLLLMDSSSNNDVVATQRDVYNERTGREKYYCFINALGGVDTVICQGQNLLEPDIELSIGRFGDAYRQINDAENHRKWKQHTGHIQENHKNWFYELLTRGYGALKYDPSTKMYNDIVLSDVDMSIGDGNPIGNASFSYIMASADNLVADTERPELYLHQSIANQVDDPEDLTSEINVVIVSDGHGGSSTEAMAIPSDKLFVRAAGNIEIYYLINDREVSSFNPTRDRMPVVIEIQPGDTVRFKSQDEMESLTINYYPITTQTAQEQTES